MERYVKRAISRFIIEGESIKVVHHGKTNFIGKRSHIFDEGIIIKHTKTGKRIIGRRLDDKNSEEIGGCSDGSSEIDFKKKLLWSC